MLISELHLLTGGLSQPSKMPGFAYGLPAWKCLLGSILARKNGTVCSDCYALKGMYVFPVVKRAQERRLESISHPRWVEWMTELISKKYRKVTRKKDRVFRWHDSGDLQSVEHLSRIVQIAKNLPTIRFWLPTRERKIVRSFDGEIPKNLLIRVSMTNIGQEAGKEFRHQSTVGAEKGFQCPARSQDNECKNCRACWDEKVFSVNYSQH